MKWQPIETAPKCDEVLAYRHDAGVFFAIYGSIEEVGIHLDDDVRDDISEGDLWNDVWWYYGSDGVVRLEGDEIPTHWMPLPEPPETQ